MWNQNIKEINITKLMQVISVLDLEYVGYLLHGITLIVLI